MMASTGSSLPSNVHVSTHPCIQAKLSQLRSASTHPRDFKTAIHEVALLVAAEAYAKVFRSVQDGVDKSPLGDSFPKHSIAPSRVNIVPILRSGLAMVDAAASLLPFSVPVNHLGMFRNRQLEPVEYYNNLSDHQADGPVDLAIVVDPIIATGVTCLGAIDSLRQYGAGKIVVLSVLCAEPGIERVAAECPDVDFWVGGCDPQTDPKGWIRPGMGDVGDRLFLTVGKH